MSRFRRATDDTVNGDEPDDAAQRSAGIEDDPDFIIDAEIVEEPAEPLEDRETPMPSGPPMLVVVAQLQDAVRDLRRSVDEHLEVLGSRLDAIELRLAADASTDDEPVWVGRLERSLEAHGSTGATATAAAITTMGEQQRADLADILGRFDQLRDNDAGREIDALRTEIANLAIGLRDAPVQPVAPPTAPSIDPAAIAEIVERLADIRAALRLLVG